MSKLLWAAVMAATVAGCKIEKTDSQSVAQLKLDSQCLDGLIMYAMVRIKPDSTLRGRAQVILAPECASTAKTRPNARLLRAEAEYYLKHGTMPRDTFPN